MAFIYVNTKTAKQISGVSSRNQKDDLERQIAFLKNQYPNHELITDIGSGINFKGKEFNALLERILSGDVAEIVVTHRDRLCRFGFELIESVAKKYNCTIVDRDLNGARGIFLRALAASP